MEFIVNAEKRERKGTSYSRNIRREGLVPGIIYGAGKAEEIISLNKFEVAKNLENDAFYSQVLDISLEGKKQQVILRDIQRHPAKREILHMDFQRIKADEKINVTVPINFINEDIAPGVKIDGGVISHLISELEIVSLPANIPENITVDLKDLSIDKSIHLSELTLPEGVEITLLQHGVEDSDMAVVVIHKARAEEVEEDLTAAPEASEVASDQKNDESNEKDKESEE
ncbi:MAG: 50S ribosomal protein L25/general stress protein Ctc [Gammaproteobacteria bacterium]|jgi:large subunit ribosomal protein L25|nr:50S ribosomal protein L25/general stress protein Ctc [Gammaproteobacteria bacterium]